MGRGRVLVLAAGLVSVAVACGGDDGGGSSTTATAAGAVTTTTNAEPTASAGDFDDVIDVDGRGVHLVCSGEGTPVVMVEMGAGQTASYWSFAQSELDDANRVCVYERAGTGSSEAGPQPRTAQAVADELATLIDTVGFDPVVLLSHSLGGLDAQAFAERHADDLVGLVFVDPRTAGYQVGFRENLTPDELAQDRQDVEATIANEPFGAELAVIDDSAAEVVAGGGLPDLPTVVLTAGVPFPDQSRADRDFWVQTHVDLAAQSSEGAQRVVEGADHDIFRTNPREVAAAIAEVSEG